MAFIGNRRSMEISVENVICRLWGVNSQTVRKIELRPTAIGSVTPQRTTLTPVNPLITDNIQPNFGKLLARVGDILNVDHEQGATAIVKHPPVGVSKVYAGSDDLFQQFIQAPGVVGHFDYSDFA